MLTPAPEQYPVGACCANPAEAVGPGREGGAAGRGGARSPAPGTATAGPCTVAKGETSEAGLCPVSELTTYGSRCCFQAAESERGAGTTDRSTCHPAHWCVCALKARNIHNPPPRSTETPGAPSPLGSRPPTKPATNTACGFQSLWSGEPTPAARTTGRN